MLNFILLSLIAASDVKPSLKLVKEDDKHTSEYTLNLPKKGVYNVVVVCDTVEVKFESKAPASFTFTWFSEAVFAEPCFIKSYTFK